MGKRVVCFGEVLWDNLPSGRVPGGAPMNVAIRLQTLGFSSRMITRVGDDRAGDELLSYLGQRNVDTSLAQVDNKYPTGEVLVNLDAQGIPTYDIVSPSAWDFIALEDEGLSAAAAADLLVFGSLACRSVDSLSTLEALLAAARYKVFDVNIRLPFYDIAVVDRLMRRSDFIKMNDEELLLISTDLGSNSTNVEENMHFIASLSGAGMVCVTLGDKGALLFANGVVCQSNGFRVDVVDTVGAGDSFLAALLHQLFTDEEPQHALRYACAVGALVASRSGANPTIVPNEVDSLLGLC